MFGQAEILVPTLIQWFLYLQTLTGTKFLLVVEPNTPYVPALLRRCASAFLPEDSCAVGVIAGIQRGSQIYEVYSDYVLKNPFYEVEQMSVKTCASNEIKKTGGRGRLSPRLDPPLPRQISVYNSATTQLAHPCIITGLEKCTG
eukprot:873337-Pelagomonas_calceolata.AAC.7